MKFRFAVLGALILLLCSGWILSTSSSFNACQTNQTAAKSEQANENSPPLTLSVADKAAICGRCILHLIYENRDAATAVATVFIALFTFTLWRSTQRLMQVTQESAKLTERSLTMLEGPIIIIGTITMDLRGPPSVPVIKLQFKNHGRGPAIITEVWTEL